MYQFLINPDNEVLLMIDAISGREEEPYAEYERSRRSLRLVKNPSEAKLFSRVNKDVAEILNEKAISGSWNKKKTAMPATHIG